MLQDSNCDLKNFKKSQIAPDLTFREGSQAFTTQSKVFLAVLKYLNLGNFLKI